MKIIIHKTKKPSPVAQAFAEPMSLESEIEFCKLEAVEELLQFIKREGIKRTQLAERMGVPPSRITKMLDGSENLTIATLVRAGLAVGAELKIGFQAAAKSSKAGAPRTQASLPTGVVYPAKKKSPSASRVVKSTKGKSVKMLTLDESISRVAEDPAPYRVTRKSK